MKQLSVDIGEAKKFLKMLDSGTDIFTFQCFHPDRKKPPSNIIHGSMDRLAEELATYNSTGYGVYVTVNETDGLGRKIKNINRIRAVWQEDDDGWSGDLPLKPSIVVNTSVGKYHRYFLLNDKDRVCKIKFDQVQRSLVEYYGSDKNAWDVTRVLRVPGFYNTKSPKPKNWHKVTIDGGTGKAIPWKKIKKRIGYIKKNKVTNTDWNGPALDSQEAIMMIAEAEEYYQPMLTVSMSMINKGIDDINIQAILETGLNFGLKARPNQDKEVWNQRFEGIAQMIKSARAKVNSEKKVVDDKKLEEFQAILDKAKTFDELITTKFKPLKWAINGLLPVGLTIIGGRPKMGKSFFCLDMCNSVTKGEKILGEATTSKGMAIYASLEDHDRRIASRLNDMDKGDCDALVIHELPLVREGCEEVISLAKKKHPNLNLFIIDTMTAVLPQQKGGQDGYAYYYPLLTSLHHLAIQLDIAIVLIHHLKKGKQEGGNGFDSLLGSVGLQGAVDSMWIMDRTPNQNTGKFLITGRDMGERQLFVEFDPERLIWLMKDKMLVDSENESDHVIAKAIDGSADKMLSQPDLMEQTGMSSSNVSRRLSRKGGCFEVADKIDNGNRLITYYAIKSVSAKQEVAAFDKPKARKGRGKKK